MGIKGERLELSLCNPRFGILRDISAELAPFCAARQFPNVNFVAGVRERHLHYPAIFVEPTLVLGLTTLGEQGLPHVERIGEELPCKGKTFALGE